MSKGPGGVTAHIDCMIISGFPGIGKTSTYQQMKKDFIGAKVIDMDVRNYGTTNGINVADPAEYARLCKEYSKENACIFVSSDPQVREALRRAELFYIVIAPEFPPAIAGHIPNYRPDITLRSRYMSRFSENLGYNSLCAETLDGKGYEDALVDLFGDPMPHLIVPPEHPYLNKAMVDQAWMAIEQMTRQVMTPGQLMGMPGAPVPPGMPPMPGGMPPIP